MSTSIHDVTVSWSWSGDPTALQGFNVALFPAGGDPNTDAVAFARAGKDATSFTFSRVAVPEGGSLDAAVQALYEGKDSNWVTVGGVAINDDGTASVTPRLSATSGSRWEFKPGQYFRIYDASGAVVFEALLDGVNGGDITLGKTSGGYIQLDADQAILKIKATIEAGSSGYSNLSDKPTSLSSINSSEGSKLDGIESGATNDSAWRHLSDTTKIDGGQIYTGSITADKINVTDLAAINANTGNLTVSGQVKSSNYLPGSAGFSINSDGTAEFNNATVRGTVVVGAGSSGYANLTDKPPLAQSLWVPPDGELFAFAEHFSGSKGTIPL